MSKTAVVIPNLNGKDKIGDCLDSLLLQTNNIIVVENGSTDGSLEYRNAPDPPSVYTAARRIRAVQKK